MLLGELSTLCPLCLVNIDYLINEIASSHFVCADRFSIVGNLVGYIHKNPMTACLAKHLDKDVIAWIDFQQQLTLNTTVVVMLFVDVWYYIGKEIDEYLNRLVLAVG